MRNKEIEEILEGIKVVIKHNGTLEFDVKELKILLSYIETLEKRNKELYEGFMATQEELTDYATKNEQLENNRDKAIDKLYCWGEVLQPDFQKGMLKILRGDSDE